MLLSFNRHSQMYVVATAVALLGLGEVWSQEASVFDLEWDGPETSTVDECVDGDNFCYTLPITGSIEVGYESDAPYLLNLTSDILLPPQVPGSRPVISPNLWSNFDLLQGEYLTTTNDDEVSMVFRPTEMGGMLRAYEIFVNITDAGKSLELTGGIEQSAASPLEPDVRFSVSGMLIGSDSEDDDIVDGLDFLELQRGYAASPAPVTSDMTGTGVTSSADIQRWQVEYGTVRDSSAVLFVATVPEPSTAVLAILLATTGLVCCSRQRNENAACRFHDSNQANYDACPN
ncbi:hypothetical protein [Adhaeretor mobilis]|uniref:PEP-CTERM protein-sorting domain-containing protein n=1 Tax=Adhaeretor mobilis TaxID=1930276 RepID=A0A517MV70_9BACT|nr:hypothetical protein [Adhaeretor mobilis]QDS98776.1 hypothetical protein HG15A2_20610 [Adhaeretor mobilis]